MLLFFNRFLELNSYFIDENNFKKYLISHPEYSSILSIKDTLSFLKIEALVVKLNKFDISELPINTITIIDNNTPVCIEKMNADSITFFDEKLISHTLTIKDFLSRWTTVVLAVDENTERRTSVKKKDKRILYYFLLIFICTSTIFINHGSWLNLVYFILSLFGIYLSYVAATSILGFDSSDTINKICKPKANINCSDIISSKGGVLVNDITLSDISFFFFFEIAIFTLLNISSSSFYGILSLLCFPVVIYSFVYQKFIIKKWCVICLAISFLLIIMSVLSIGNINKFVIYEYVNFFSLFIIFLFIWSLLKPILKSFATVKIEHNNSIRIKRNFRVFKLNLDKKIIIDDLKFRSSLFIGKTRAYIPLTIFISPSCKYCNITFEKAYFLYKKYPDLISINVLFNVDIDNNKSQDKNIALIIMDKIIKGENEIALRKLIMWHVEKKSYENFMTEDSLSKISYKVTNELRDQHLWCVNKSLNYTPIILIGNKIFPDTYTIDEIEFFINEIKNGELTPTII